jgi:hypothetical protein
VGAAGFWGPCHYLYVFLLLWCSVLVTGISEGGGMYGWYSRLIRAW